MLDIHIAKTEKEMQDILKIREEVFIKGQNVPPERERDGLDASSEHAIMYDDKEPAGCARIRYKGDIMKLERIAVREKFRGKEYGHRLMEFLINYAKQKDVPGIIMEAQSYLIKFYNKHGFEERGDHFKDAGIDHVEMFREMKPSK